MIHLELGYAAADRLLEELARDVERAAVDCGGVAGRESGSRMAITVPGVYATSDESLAATLRGRAPERLEVVTACTMLSPARAGRSSSPVPGSW